MPLTIIILKGEETGAETLRDSYKVTKVSVTRNG
jgi:hypothetical protein